MTKRIRFIYTGGTVGGKEDYGVVLYEDLKPEKFISVFLEKFPNLKGEIELSYSTPIKKFSEEIMPSDWVETAKDVYKAIDKEHVDGVVVAHGTDTMAYTSSAISFMLNGLKVPVILTGSNRPITHLQTDALRNMHDAILVAKDGRFKGVFVVFSGVNERPSTIHLGTRVRKVKFFDNNYKSINRPSPMGIVEEKSLLKGCELKILDKELFGHICSKNANSHFKLVDKFDPNISFVKIYPGFDPGTVQYGIYGIGIGKNEKGKRQVQTKPPVRGVILELYNSGTAATQHPKYSILDTLSLANERNIPVFITSQHGRQSGNELIRIIH